MLRPSRTTDSVSPGAGTTLRADRVYTSTTRRIPACGRSPTASARGPTPSNSLPARGQRIRKPRSRTRRRHSSTLTTSTPSSQQVTYAYSGTSNSDLELIGDPLNDSEAEALFGPDYTPTGNYDHIWDVLFDIMDSASENIMTTLSDAERAPLADAVENTLTGTSPPEEPSQTHSRTWGEFFWENIHSGLDVAGLVPGFGEFADGTNALLYLSEGNYTEAGLSAAAMVPIGGTGVTTAKWTKMVLKRLVPPQILQIPQSVERKLPVLLRMPRN